MTWRVWPAPDPGRGGLSDEDAQAVAALWAEGSPPGRLGATGARSEVDRLGWVDLPFSAAATVAGFAELRRELLDDGLERVVVVAMGGAGRSPRTLVRTLPRGSEPGLEVRFLNSLAPEAVRKAIAPETLLRTAFLIASKSGTTVETRALEAVIGRALHDAGGSLGRQFMALSDPGTPLFVHARAAGYRRVFAGLENVGGRFSALSAFGLLPAVLAGGEVERGLAAARRVREALDAPEPPADDPGVGLGVLLSRLAASGRSRAHLSAAPAFEAMLPWLEQLFAENTGKEGKGILPVILPPPPRPREVGDEVFLIHLGGAEGEDRERLDAAAAAGVTVIHSDPTPDEAMGEVFRWQVATAVAAHRMGVNPYDEPDVVGAKEAARRLVRAPDSAPAPPAVSDGEVLAFLEAAREGGLAINAFGHRGAAAKARLAEVQRGVAARLGIVPAVGFGSALLHSLGQLEKGGPDSLSVLMLSWGPEQDLSIPPTEALPETAAGLGLGRLAHLQAAADYAELRRLGREVLWLAAEAGGEDGLRELLPRLGLDDSASGR